MRADSYTGSKVVGNKGVGYSVSQTERPQCNKFLGRNVLYADDGFFISKRYCCAVGINKAYSINKDVRVRVAQGREVGLKKNRFFVTIC